MKTQVQTRIFIGMTVEEARRAVNDAVDLQLAVRQALYEVDGTPIAVLAEQNGNGHKQLTVPATPATPEVHRNGHGKREGRTTRPKARTPRTDKTIATMVECPDCHQMIKARGVGVHMARKHKASIAPAVEPSATSSIQ